MAIYAKKLNGKQRKMLKRYESISGFEPMGQDDLDSGEMSFKDLWSLNIRFIEDVLAEIQNISETGAIAY